MSKQHFDATTFITENLTPLFYAATHHQELFLNFLFTQIQKDIKNGQFVEATMRSIGH